MQPVFSESQDSPQMEWQQQLRDSLTTVYDLVRFGLISSQEANELQSAQNPYQIRLTPYYASLIGTDSHCPIRQQALPFLGEKDPVLPTWATQISQTVYHRPCPWDPDPIGDVAHIAAPRITHRYAHRAILHISSTCAVFCRFCFRKNHLNDHTASLYEGSLDPAFNYLANTPQIREIILTGGDPLSLPDVAFKRFLTRLATLPQIRTVRIHSRMCVTLPQRFTPSLLEILGAQWPFQIALVSHFNHPLELTHIARNALKGLRAEGILLLNQSVLLKNVNDTPETLYELFQSLYELGSPTFHLHHPDWTPGTFHFRISIEKGRSLCHSLAGRLSGPAMPDYILDIPGGFGKISLLGTHVRKKSEYPSLGDHLKTPLKNEKSLKGALYEVLPPNTRKPYTTPQLYFDCFAE